MPFARRYETFELRGLLQAAEGTPSPLTAAPGHSRERHAMTPGGLDPGALLHRVTRNPGETQANFRARDGARMAGAFQNQLQQSEAACTALNSAAGQAALGTLDDPAYAANGVRVTLTVPGILQAAIMPAVGPQRGTSAAAGHMMPQNGQVTAVRLIIDRGPAAAAFQIQTCYPLFGPVVNAAWEARTRPGNAVIGHG